ncbi:MAG: peptidoglycan-binding domain-containing protein [Candidatus Nanopelagicales bacterium]|nr:peptidoglycan-binding domain-containing protein [Candidatus Nanopelagicales bacterium]MDZ4249956.1 peptidoglycan-binding domain-containing protein [Candidatus Nanopelagicales bacterium]
MNNRSSRGRRVALLAVAGAAALVIAGCSSTPSPSPTPSPTPSPSNTTVEFNKAIQGELADVGCYPGGIDGVIGPETDKAIRDFQQAAGLPVTGELDAQTDKALKNAATKGERVCKAKPSPSPTASPAAATCTATSINTVLKKNETLVSYSCAEGWAGIKAEKDGAGKVFFAQVENDKWVRVPKGEICGTASAGLPPSILDYCEA